MIIRAVDKQPSITLGKIIQTWQLAILQGFQAPRLHTAGGKEKEGGDMG